MIKINHEMYRELVKSGATTHFANNKSNRAETIKVGDEIYSADLFYNEHHYNWIQYPNGQEWYYRSESGQELKVVRR